MLTRVELSDDETHVNFAPGNHVTCSKFGQYDRLTGFTGIIRRAYIEGWTHYKDLFGVGYNYMLHPLMSYENFEELKLNIEKHFVETGKKSVLAGLSQGTNFVEIFITDYVTPEWAKKYMACVIFYAPAFAGWGTYGRSVTGNFGGGFPDSNIEMKTSTMRMPGLHIMMPNEGVYGNKTVIKEFPNKGYESNASFVAPLLQKLGKMDETTYKIFKLTDKYRKYPLPNPPVPSLIIFNDGKVNGNGYSYNEAKNTVSSFNDAGDGTVSADGSLYACSHWENASCFNYKSAYIDHSNIQNMLITYDLTFNFIERIQDYKPYPTDKTVLNEVVKDIYTDSSYISTYRIPNNQFTYFANEGVSSHPLSYGFDNNLKTYYISNLGNNISYHNNITFEFEDVVTIEAFIYGAIYSSIFNDVRNYQGFPSVLNAYTSIEDNDFQLKTVFIGTPIIPSDRIQFVFKEPVKCDKLKLEFAEVTTQKVVGYSPSPSFTNLIFIRYSNDDILSIKNAEGDFANNQYVNSHSISEFR